MAKIGILTFHSAYNFGANLQALSTMHYFKNNGYDAKIINWRPKDLWKSYKKGTPTKQIEAHEDFFRRYFDMTDICHTDDDIAQVIGKEDIDAIVIGSDAVCRHLPYLLRWRPSRKHIFLKNATPTPYIYPNAFWGCFYPKLHRKIPMIFMSVSSQGTAYRYTMRGERKKIAESLSRFSFISVRDSWTRKAFQYFSYGAVSPHVTPDPVFAFNANIPQDLTSKDFIKRFQLPEKYIVLSFKKEHSPSQNWVRQFTGCCKSKGIAVLSLPFPQEENCLDVDINLSLPINPLEWYNIIKYSSGYVGNNMHPIVVAIHNVLPFFSFDYYGSYSHLSGKVNLAPSKIYDLVYDCDLLDYYSNVQSRHYQYPQPEEVFSKICQYDSDKGRLRSADMQNRYMQLMIDIETVIKKKQLG